MDNFWSLEQERQKIVNDLHLGSPGEDEYEANLKALEKVDKLIPPPEKKEDDKIHWNRILEQSLPALAGIAVVVILEQFGQLFTTKGTMFWKKP